MIGETVGGRYEVLRALGEGGMGAVFEARHTGTGRRVALKTIHPGKVKSQQLLARFRIEARAAGSIESEYVVQVFDVDVDEPRRMPFLAMEYLSGEDLDALLDKLGTVPQDLALRIAAQTCLGLEKAHAGGVLHRDIKPANLILSKRDGGERRVKIVDFGLAKALDDGDAGDKAASLTMTGMLLGSPQYMSPEQARAEKGLDARTDVWSLGMVIYQMLTGRTAFKGVTPIPKLLEAITSQPVAPIRETAPWVDLGVATAVERALEIDPARRHPSIRALREALLPFLPSGVAISEAMLVAGPKPEQAQPRIAQQDIATVVKPPAAEKPAPAAGAQPVKPTKVSGKPETGEPVAPGTEPLPKMVIPVEVVADTGDSAPRKPAAGTLVSGGPERPAPTVRGPVEARSTEVAPMTERVEPIDRTEQAANAPKALIPQAPAALRQKKGLPIVAILVAGAAIAALAVAITWAARQTGNQPTTAAIGSIPLPAPTSATAAATERPTAPSPPRKPSPLIGKWKTDSGKQLEAVDVHGDIEFRVAEVKGFAEQGYRVGEARFTLKPRPGGDLYDVVDHVRPLPLTGMTFDESSRPSCLVAYTEVANKPLTARVDDKGHLIVTVTYLVPTKAMFESAGNRITKCKDLEQSRTSPIENPLTRAN